MDMAQYEHLPIYKKMFDLAVYIERIVKNFSRYHKYTLGSEMRNLSREVLGLVIKANQERDKREILLKMREKIEDLKISARLAKELKAFNNFNSFECLVKMIVEVAGQNEGWLRSQNPARSNGSGRERADSHGAPQPPGM
jgi:hypothetical protein